MGTKEEQVPLLFNEKDDETRSLEEGHQINRVARRRPGWIGAVPFFALCLFLLWTVALDISEEQDEPDVCLTPGCVLASAELLTSRSPNYANIDPCDDFRSYMCEGFDATHDFRSDQSDIGSLSLLAERGQALLKHILEAPMPKVTLTEASSVDEHNFVKLRNAYGACLNETAIAEQDAGPLHELVEEIWKAGAESLAQANIFLASIGVQPFLELDIRVRGVLDCQISR